MPLEAGQSAQVERVVTPDLTADAFGNPGVKVLATPCVVTLLENAAHAVMKPHLPAGAGTVGTMVEMKHLAPTPLGMKVRAKATLVETDGKRCLFQVEAYDEVEKIAEGRHERFVIPNLEKFLDRAMKKGKA